MARKWSPRFAHSGGIRRQRGAGAPSDATGAIFAEEQTARHRVPAILRLPRHRVSSADLRRSAPVRLTTGTASS